MALQLRWLPNTRATSHSYILNLDFPVQAKPEKHSTISVKRDITFKCMEVQVSWQICYSGRTHLWEVFNTLPLGVSNMSGFSIRVADWKLWNNNVLAKGNWNCYMIFSLCTYFWLLWKGQLPKINTPKTNNLHLYKTNVISNAPPYRLLLRRYPHIPEDSCTRRCVSAWAWGTGWTGGRDWGPRAASPRSHPPVSVAASNLRSLTWTPDSLHCNRKFMTLSERHLFCIFKKTHKEQKQCWHLSEFYVIYSNNFLQPSQTSRQ